MYNNNLTELLKTFSLQEIKEFREFLNSSYFNKRQAVNNLYEIIIKFHPDYENKSFTKQNIFEKLFSGKRYNDSSLRVLTHYLAELAEKFLAFQRFESNDLEFSIQLETVLRERNLNKLFEKNINKAFNKLSKTEVDAEDFYFYKFRLEDQRTYYQFVSNYAYVDKIISTTDWDKVFKDLTNYYIIKSMFMYLNTLNIHTLYNKQFKSESFGNMFKRIRIEDYNELPIIKMYYYLLKLKIDKRHESYYFKLKEILFKIKKELNRYDLTAAYVQMGSYCIKRISEGDTKFERERFDLYKEELIENTYLMSDNTMSPLFYRNVVISGLSLKELKWVRDFIYTYKPELNKKFRENYFYYALALYEFNMRNFQYSLELISKIKYDEVYMKLNSKILHLQILYELGFEDTLASTLESFRHFLNNNKLIPDEKKAPLFNFHRYLNKIISENTRKNKSELDLLQNNILKETILINKNWLLEKVKSL